MIEPNGFYINGISTARHDAKEQAQLIGTRTGLYIRCFHNPDNGILIDLVECFWGRWLGWLFPRRIIKDIVTDLEWILEKTDGDFHIFAHSQGCIIAMNAMKALPKKYRFRMILHLFAVTNAYQVEGLKLCEYFRNRDDYVSANLPGDFVFRIARTLGRAIFEMKFPRGKEFNADGSGHSFLGAYWNRLDEFVGYKESNLYHLIQSETKKSPDNSMDSER